MKTLLKAPLAAAGLLVFASISPNEINAFPQSWGGSQQVPGVGHEGDGAGVALYDIDNNGRLDMILMAYDDPSGSNEFRYRVGKNVDQNGRVASWSGWRRIAGMGHNGDGAGVALADE